VIDVDEKQKMNTLEDSQTWGQVQNLEAGDHAQALQTWFNAGLLETTYTQEQSPNDLVHKFFDSFEKTVIDAGAEVPFRFVVTPVILKVGSDVLMSDAVRLAVKIEPTNSEVSIGQLKEFAQQVREK